MNRVFKFTAGLILVCIVGYLLVALRSLLIPIVIAVLIWNLLNTVTNTLYKTPLIGARLPYGVRMLLSLLLVVILTLILVSIVDNNVSEVSAASSRYQANLTRMLAKIEHQSLLKLLASLDNFVKNINMQHIVTALYGVFSVLMSSAVLIILYVMFLFVEQHVFKQKMDALFPQPAHRRLVDTIIAEITQDIQTYLGLKTMLGVAAALMGWVVMRAVGLDFAEFWALLIFLLSYVPNLGPIVAAIFPALLAMIQFQGWWPFVVITSGLVTIQFVMGNLVEPRFLGKSLNLSPLVILFSLGFWGMIWGVLGMFLAVPITVMMMIVFAHFEATRPFAILLSQNGHVVSRTL